MPGTTDPDDELVSWEWNPTTPAEPPPDRADWVRIIRETVPRSVRVVLTTDGQGRWRVSIAEELRVGSGPIDHRAAVTAALRSAKKRVRD